MNHTSLEYQHDKKNLSTLINFVRKTLLVGNVLENKEITKFL